MNTNRPISSAGSSVVLPTLHTSIEIVDDLKRIELPGIIAVFLTIKAGELKFSLIKNM